MTLSYEGVCEATRNCNCGPRVEHIQRTAGLPKRSPWCSGFCITSYKEAKIPIPAGVNGLARSWFPVPAQVYKHGKWLYAGVVSRPMDMLGFNNGGAAVQHVAFQRSEWGQTAMVYSIEGNYSDCVKVVLRPKRTVSVIARHLAN